MSKLQTPYVLVTYRALAISLLFINYFLAQYDKFILSYFQVPLSQSLSLSSSQYGILSGYATGIIYALAALPIAFLADFFPQLRVWTLAVAAVWWSVCVIFQSYAQSFTQLLLARIAMGIGQACVEPLSISLISDVAGSWRNVFIGGSVFYVGVYIGEAISGQIATAFSSAQTGWKEALRSIGITGIVVALLVRVVVRDYGRQPGFVHIESPENFPQTVSHKWIRARRQLTETLIHLLHLQSFWILLGSASIRQLAGNVFGFYMPSYLSVTYSEHRDLLSDYGIIVGTVGSVTVLMGGAITSLCWKKTKTIPLYLTAVGGMLSSVFVLIMVFSLQMADGEQDKGIKILYGAMSLAYATAELWLGALNGLVAGLMPPKYKTFGLAIWSAIQVLIYSSGPEIIGLALGNDNPESKAYAQSLRVILAITIPLCYWLAAAGFLAALPPLRRDFAAESIPQPQISRRKKLSVYAVGGIICSLVISLFVCSIYYAANS